VAEKNQSFTFDLRFQRGRGSGCTASIILVPESIREAAGVFKRILAFLLSVVIAVRSSISLERSFSLCEMKVLSPNE
jgi:hypothetical protein